MAAYSLTSASLMIINKALMKEAQLASFFSIIQFAAAAGTVHPVLSCTGACPKEDVELRSDRVKAYAIYSIVFSTVIYSNLQALCYSSVATVLVFRALVPLLVSVLDFFFLGRELPNLRFTLALLTIAGATVAYVYTDKQFKANGLRAYTWVSIYASSLSIEMAYAKHIVGPQMGFKGIWGSVYHNNLLSIPLMTVLAFVTQEQRVLLQTTWSPYLLCLVGVSCVASVAISYTGWNCRKLVSASCYTVLGVGNKMLTILGSSLIWGGEASWIGQIFLFICLVGACCYQQAPIRSEERQCGPMWAAIKHGLKAVEELLQETSSLERATARYKRTDGEVRQLLTEVMSERARGMP